MLTHEIATTVSLDTFRQRSAGKKVILLYPWTNYRTLFLSHFMAESNPGLLYYRINSTQSTLGEWLRGMSEEFKQVLGKFGKNLKTALAKGNPAALGEALAADLAAYGTDGTILFVDELDRIPFDRNFEQFMTALVGALPAGVQVAFNSRLLTYTPWIEMVRRGEAVVLGTEYRKNNVMFTVEEHPRPQLEVYSLGRGYALVNGQQITNWDGALPRNLFFFFMDRPLVTRKEIFETFWPNLSVKEATNVFHVTKRKITERISMKIAPGESYELTQYINGFYVPSEKVTRHYDVSDFQTAVERALVTNDVREEERLLVSALELYKAPFLQEGEMTWIKERREQLRQLHAQALIGLARLTRQRGEDERALGYFIRSLEEVPEREDIHRDVMNLYLRLGRPHDAREHYARLESNLREKFNIAPSKETRDLLKVIKAAL